MGFLRALRRLALRSILRSALNLEEEIYGLLEELPAELGGLELPASLRRIIAEEKEHRRLLQEMIAGRLPGQEIERLLAGQGPHVHDPESLKPLAAGPHRRLVQPLRRILAQEEKIYRFFDSLRGKSRLPFVRQAFRFLAEQEQTHVLMLRTLLGEPG